MKVNEILTKKELDDCQKWGIIWSYDDIELALAQHYPEMEVKDFLLYRILTELENLNGYEERKANEQGY